MTIISSFSESTATRMQLFRSPYAPKKKGNDTGSQKIFPVHSYAVGASPPNPNACASLKFYDVLGKRNLEKPRKQMITDTAHNEKYYFVSNKELIFLGKYCFLNLVSLSSSLNYPPISIFHQQTTPKPTVISLNRDSTNIATYSWKTKYICLYCDLEEKQHKNRT